MVLLRTRHYFLRNETGSESMPYRARNQSRSRLGRNCYCSPQFRKCLWCLHLYTSWRLYMTEARIDTCIRWKRADMCSGIFSLWRHTLHGTCLRVGRGWTHSTCYDSCDQSRLDEKIPRKKSFEIIFFFFYFPQLFLGTASCNIQYKFIIQHKKKKKKKGKKRSKNPKGVCATGLKSHARHRP